MTENVAAVPATRGALIRWIGWFGIFNAGLYALVGLQYAFAFGLPDSGIAITYMVLAFIAQFALLGFIPTMLLLGPVALLVPRKGLIFSLGVLLAAIGLSLVVLDTNIFSEYRYHVSRLTLEIFETSTWVLTGVVFVALLGFQSMLAGAVWKQVSAKQNRRGGWLALALVFVWCGGQGIHIWADATAYSPVTSFTPLYAVVFSDEIQTATGQAWLDRSARS